MHRLTLVILVLAHGSLCCSGGDWIDKHESVSFCHNKYVPDKFYKHVEIELFLDAGDYTRASICFPIPSNVIIIKDFKDTECIDCLGNPLGYSHDEYSRISSIRAELRAVKKAMVICSSAPTWIK